MGFLIWRTKSERGTTRARDSLLDWTVFEIGKRANKGGLSIDAKTLLHSLEGHKECPVCENPIDHFTGFYRRIPVDGHMVMAKAEASTRLLTRTGINRETGTVQEGILDNRKASMSKRASGAWRRRRMR